MLTFTNGVLVSHLSPADSRRRLLIIDMNTTGCSASAKCLLISNRQSSMEWVQSSRHIKQLFVGLIDKNTELVSNAVN